MTRPPFMERTTHSVARISFSYYVFVYVSIVISCFGFEGRCNSLSCPPGQLAPRGQDIPGYLAPHPGYLHPQGASCPGRFIFPPPAKNKKTFFLTFCNFSAKQQEFNIILQSFKVKIMSDLHFGVMDYWGQAVQGGLSCPHPEY